MWGTWSNQEFNLGPSCCEATVQAIYILCSTPLFLIIFNLIELLTLKKVQKTIFFGRHPQVCKALKSLDHHNIIYSLQHPACVHSCDARKPALPRLETGLQQTLAAGISRNIIWPMTGPVIEHLTTSRQRHSPLQYVRSRYLRISKSKPPLYLVL